MKTADDWLTFLYQHKEYEPRKGAMAFMHLTVHAATLEELNLINHILENAQPDKLSKHAVQAMLRSTSTYKERLPAWEPFLKKIYMFYQTQNIEMSLLVGLTKYLEIE